MVALTVEPHALAGLMISRKFYFQLSFAKAVHAQKVLDHSYVTMA